MGWVWALLLCGLSRLSWDWGGGEVRGGSGVEMQLGQERWTV